MDGGYKSFGNWSLKRTLGTGGFGEVLHWKNRQTNLEIATKSLKRNNNLGSDEEHKLKQRWQQEYELANTISIEYIVKGVKLEDQNFLNYLNEQHAWHPLKVLVMEYCNAGDLRSHLQKMYNLNGLIEYEICNVLYCLRHAVEYLHNSCNIKHRDLKPDNIVIHQLPNGERIYKLTDFGFARSINENTMLQSVVGTRNYFAPEVVDTAEYTKTVDYWSIGVIAFEMLCGTLPFIPHQSIYYIIKSIKNKPANCIAITESFKEPNTFENHARIFDENRVSGVFRNIIEYWLRLALDKNFRTRGKALAGLTEIPNSSAGGRIPKFYSALDELLTTRVLTVCSLCTYSLHDYEIKSDTTVKQLAEAIFKDTGIPLNRLFTVLPVGHKLKSVSLARKAEDFYMENWRNLNDNSNPRVMIYIIDIDATKPFIKYADPKVSVAFKHCLGIAEHEKLPLWLLQKFAFDIHYLLAREQEQLTTLLYGLREYAMTIEEEILQSKPNIDELLPEAQILIGAAVQYGTMIAAAKNQLQTMSWTENFFTSWEASVERCHEKIKTIINKVLSSLQTRFNSVLRHIRDECQSAAYLELAKKDVFELNLYRQHLQAQHQCCKFESLQTQVNNCKYCCDAAYRFLDNRPTVLNSFPEKCMRNLAGLHQEYKLIVKTTKETAVMLKQIHEEITKYTHDFNKMLIVKLRNNSQHNTKLSVDGNQSLTTSTLSNVPSMTTSINGLCASMTNVMHISTNDLIREAEDNMQLLSMDIDMSDIPTTINLN